MATTKSGKESTSTSTSVGKEKRSRTGDKASGSEKQVPNYVKPTISSGLEPHQRSFQLSSLKANLERRRSFDRPPSLKQSSLSSSRLHKALVSPVPRERTVPRRLSSSSSSSSSLSAKSSASTKPISKTTITVRDGKLHKKVSTSSKTTVKKTSPSNRNKQQASSANSSTKAPKSNINAETTEKAPPNVEEAQSHDSIVEETSALVNVEHEPQIIKADHNDMINIPTESEEATEKAEEEKPTEIHDIEHQAVNQEEKSNDVITQPQEISSTEGELLEVKEKEEDAKEELEVTEEEGDERASEEVDSKENVKGEGDDHQVENSVTEEEGSKSDETIKNESTATATPTQVATNSWGKGKESRPQAYNDVIEETKNKLMGARKNKVSALVGAFQTVIDYQSSSK